jgi:hypothetical protein
MFNGGMGCLNLARVSKNKTESSMIAQSDGKDTLFSMVKQVVICYN